MSRRPLVLALGAAVAVTAVALRAWRLGWGLGDGDFFFDEILFAQRAERFVPFSCQSFNVAGDTLFPYPPFYGYLTGAAYALGRGLGAFGAPFTHILAARAVSAAAGVATVGLVAVAAARLYSVPAGLAAAALFAVAPFHVLQSHIAATDVVLTAVMTLVLVAAHALATRPGGRTAVLAGVAAGLAFATKYTGGAALAPIAWALWTKRASARVVLGLGLAVLAGFAGAVALGCPPCVLHPERMLVAMGRHRALVTEAAPFYNNRLTDTLGWYGHPYLYQLVAALPYALGWPLYGLALLGVVVALRRRTSADGLVLAAILPYLAVVGGAHTTFPRFLLPLLPPLVILAARAVTDGETARVPRAALLAGVWLYSLALTVSQVGRFSWDQQRAAAAWIGAAAERRHVPLHDLRVAVPRLWSDYFRLERALASHRLRVVPVIEGHWLDRAPEVLVIPDWYTVAARRDRLEGPLADLERLESGTAGYRPAARWRSTYLQEGFYTWLDPAFAADLWQGEIGITVYVRSTGPLAGLEGPRKDAGR